MIANLNDRRSIMAIYPLERFEADAHQNSMATATTRHGVLIESAPDHGGTFLLRGVAKAIGEGHRGPEALFICPYMGMTYQCFALLDGSLSLEAEIIDISEQ